MEIVADAIRYVLPFYPAAIQARIEREMPSIVCEAAQIAAQVMLAEEQGITFAEASHRADCFSLAKIHHNVRDTLQRRVPVTLRASVKRLAAAAVSGAFDDVRRGLFISARRNDPHGALFRFAFYQGARMNEFVRQWDDALPEAVGMDERVDRIAEERLRALLDSPRCLGDDEIRPVNLLSAEVATRVIDEMRAFEPFFATRGYVADGFEFVERLITSTEVTRSLDARDAAVIRGEARGLGARRLMDLHPHHFESEGAVYAQRHRASARVKKLLLEREGDVRRPEPEIRQPSDVRIIDILRGVAP